MNDYSSQIVENIKWFMFGDESKEIINDDGFSHGLKFLTWVGDGHAFIITDETGAEYRVYVSKEEI